VPCALAFAWWFGEGEAKSEGGAGSGGVAGEIATVQAGDAAGDGEAESVAWGGSGEAGEALEDAFSLGAGDAGAVVGDEGFKQAAEGVGVCVDGRLLVRWATPSSGGWNWRTSSPSPGEPARYHP
jgi:hypothetical protein